MAEGGSTADAQPRVPLAAGGGDQRRASDIFELDAIEFVLLLGRDFHDPRVNIGNRLMHHTRFEGTRGVIGDGTPFPEIDAAPEHKTGTFFPSVHANRMVGFAIGSVSATEIYPGRGA